jgi:hypothetical protein
VCLLRLESVGVGEYVILENHSVSVPVWRKVQKHVRQGSSAWPRPMKNCSDFIRDDWLVLVSLIKWSTHPVLHYFTPSNFNFRLSSFNSRISIRILACECVDSRLSQIEEVLCGICEHQRGRLHQDGGLQKVVRTWPRLITISCRERVKSRAGLLCMKVNLNVMIFPFHIISGRWDDFMD